MATVGEVIEAMPDYALHRVQVTDTELWLLDTHHNALTQAEAIYEANARFLSEHWADHVITANSGYGRYIALSLDDEEPSDLAEIIEGLNDYLILCEQTLGEVEQEWITESWESWGRDEVRDHLDDDDLTDEELDRAFWEWSSNDNYGAYLEGNHLIFDAEAVAITARFALLA